MNLLAPAFKPPQRESVDLVIGNLGVLEILPISAIQFFGGEAFNCGLYLLVMSCIWGRPEPNIFNPMLLSI